MLTIMRMISSLLSLIKVHPHNYITTTSWDNYPAYPSWKYKENKGKDIL
jgi:hypothetical protein